MNQAETIIDFTGPVHYETIGELIHKLKESSLLMGMQTSIYKKVLLVLIEGMENILKYNENPDSVEAAQQDFHPSISIKKQDNTYIITLVNSLSNDRMDAVRKRIDHLNGLDEEGLKQYYKEVITNGVFSHKGGAGLGLIEMAKAASQPLSYSFKSYNQAFSTYKLCAVIEC